MKRILALAITLVMLFSLAGCASGDYKKAVSLMEAGSYEEALAMFSTLGDYEDSAELANACNYELGLAAYNDKDYDAALTYLENANGHADSSDYISRIHDAIVAEKIVGSWISEEVDVTEDILDEIVMELAYALGQYEEIDRDSLPDFSFAFQVCLDIESSGRFSEYCSDSTLESLDSLMPVVEDIFRKALEAELTAELAAEGATMEDLYAELGVDDLDSVVTALFGMSIPEFIDEIGFYDILSLAFSVSNRGTFTVEDGVITFDYTDEVEEYTYNEQDDTLTDDDGYVYTRVS